MYKVVPVCVVKTYSIWGVDIQFYSFLTLALDGGEWSASHHGCFISRDRDMGTH